MTLILPYKQEDLDNAGISDPNQLDVYTVNTTTQAWEKVPGLKTVDINNQVVMINVDHFSIFRLAVLTSSNFSFTGFFPPVDNPPTWNKAKAGSAIPVKFRVGRLSGNGYLPGEQSVIAASPL